MTTKELIRQNIDAYYAEYKDKFHQNGDPYHLGIIDGLDIAERILDTLPDEPVTDCYDLKNVSEDLEEAARDFVGFDMDRDELYEYEIGIAAFKAGAEWQKAKMLKDNPVIMSVEDFQALIDSHAKRVEADYKEKMIEGAVECVVCAGMEGDKWIMTYIGSYESMLKTCKAGDKVKIIIVKEEE